MSDEPRILVLNAGSSGIKCGAYPLTAGGRRSIGIHCDVHDAGCRLTTRPADGPVVYDEIRHAAGGETVWQMAMRTLLGRALAAAGGPIVAVGHRIVHGGLEFAGPVLVTDGVIEGIEALTPLAPLHQPHGLAGIRAATASVPTALQVACFDTAFHRSCPPVAMRFALPRRWHDAGVRRYGFHGLSYESIVAQLPGVTGGLPDRAIIAHLGAGASLCGIRAGRSLATTMGFTPLDGLVMATRCGGIDPGAVLHLILREGLSAAEVERMLWRESGLLGVSAESGDMRVLLGSDDPRGAEAIELFCHRAVREAGSLTAALGGLDAIVFTAGIGEHSAEIRAQIAAGLKWLGLEIDPSANAGHGPRISTPASRVSAWVIPTDEESVIAAHVRQVVRSHLR